MGAAWGRGGLPASSLSRAPRCLRFKELRRKGAGQLRNVDRWEHHPGPFQTPREEAQEVGISRGNTDSKCEYLQMGRLREEVLSE